MCHWLRDITLFSNALEIEEYQDGKVVSSVDLNPIYVGVSLSRNG